jgi:hypothetical protein
MSVGGCGGFFASVRAIGVTGQQQHASIDSADEDVRGGAGGFLRSFGGATNPASFEPSPPASTVPRHIVAASAEVIPRFAVRLIAIPAPLPDFLQNQFALYHASPMH